MRRRFRERKYKVEVGKGGKNVLGRGRGRKMVKRIGEVEVRNITGKERVEWS